VISALFETVKGFPVCQVANYVEGSVVVPIHHIHRFLASFDLLKFFDEEVNVIDDNAFLVLESRFREA